MPLVYTLHVYVITNTLNANPKLHSLKKTHICHLVMARSQRKDASPVTAGSVR